MIHFEYFDTIDSTNNELKRRGNSSPEFTVVSAGQQTGGRGRSGHVWKSPSHDSVATSMIMYPNVPIECVPRITTAAAMAVASAVEELYPLKTEIKWPNDILISHKKICGILTEMIPEKGKVKYVIVGIGVNVHQTSFPSDIKDIATSLDLELGGRMAKRRDVTEKIWERFMFYYDLFLKTHDLSGFLDEYNGRLVNKERPVKVLDPQGHYDGISHGVDETGRLMVERDGKIIYVDAGEVSVRGFYGYV